MPNRPAKTAQEKAPKSNQIGFTPFLSGLLGCVIQEGLCKSTAMNLLCDIYPFASAQDRAQIERLVDFSNSVNSGFGGSSRLSTYKLRRTLTEKQRIHSLLSVLQKYGGVRSGYVFRMAESLLFSGGQMNTGELIGTLLRNNAFAGFDISNIMSMFSGGIDPNMMGNLMGMFS